MNFLAMEKNPFGVVKWGETVVCSLASPSSVPASSSGQTKPTHQPNFRPNDVWTKISHLTVLPCLVHAWTTSWEGREANVACVEDKLYLLCEWLLFFDISAIYRMLFENWDLTFTALHRRNYNIDSSPSIYFCKNIYLQSSNQRIR